LIDRLDRHGYEHPYEHLVCEGAGHALEPPYLPCRGRSREPFFMGLEMALGGTAEGYAEAATKYWPRVLETLRIGTGDSPV
ncbi:MAG: acyl-CoA thioester hydrolase/BAAT C-terminal domain-containing protein, partial [Salinibacter sp.]